MTQQDLALARAHLFLKGERVEGRRYGTGPARLWHVEQPWEPAVVLGTSTTGNTIEIQFSDGSRQYCFRPTEYETVREIPA